MKSKKNNRTPTSSHWGNFVIESKDDQLVAVHPYEVDEFPSAIGQSFLDSQNPDVRISQPMVREGYISDGGKSDGSRRGKEPFVPVSWDMALDLAAKALSDVKSEYGNEAIFGGSYGWASAGRFHHAQSQVHRFLNKIGGYVDSRDDYSCATAHVLLPHILGGHSYSMAMEAPTMEDIARHGKTLLLFGGTALKNTQVNIGGLGNHSALSQLRLLKTTGVAVYNISPIKDDVTEEIGAHWLPCIPNSDAAIMLGLAHTLVDEGLQDQSFLDTYTTGWDKFLPYLTGEVDSCPKSADWAAKLSGIPADTIRELARTLASGRSVVGASWSVQRQEHGEQNYWMVTVLAAMLGHIGLPGGGVAYGYGCIHNIGFGGRSSPLYSMGALPQGENPVKQFIPVARISDMLLHPGRSYNYNGQSLVYPDIRLIYWAGGNPFHHHQDLNRLRRAWAKPETIIVNEQVWSATARHADIVFPITTSLERDDIGGSSFDNFITPMCKAVEPFGESRDDYDVFSELAKRLGAYDEFTEGRTASEWITSLYEITRENAAGAGVELPTPEEFWAGEQIDLSSQLQDRQWTLEQFRENPTEHPLTTPSGKIEIFSETIHSFGYEDCLGHPAWFDKTEWLGCALAKDYPLHLISNQPKKKLHSQLDFGRNSADAKHRGREIVRIHPQDAAARNLSDGDIVRLYNKRGSCLAATEISESIRVNVVELPTGSWFDPLDPSVDGSLEVHGNPNVLTRDIGTSSLVQGPTAQSCLVQMELYTDELPAVKSFKPPAILNK